LTVGGNTALTISNPAITKVRFTVKSGTMLPRVFSLEQNYPNPFNPATSIQFAVPEQAVLTLQVFNLLGQQVATLLDQTAYEPGNHVVNWNASNLSSGIYFYRLVATRPHGNGILFQQVKKINDGEVEKSEILPPKKGLSSSDSPFFISGIIPTSSIPPFSTFRVFPFSMPVLSSG